MAKSAKLDEEDRERVDEYRSPPASVIFEAIRREGDHELCRPASALWWSGVAAGLAISTSVLCKGFLVAVLPDTDWAPAVSNLGYTVGFLIVILAGHLTRTARLWLIVLVANLAGSLLASAVLVFGGLVPAKQYSAILQISRHYADATGMQHLMWGIPAGFIIAALVWILPRLEGAGEVLMIVILTYMIGLGGMSHGVAGSTELFILLMHGEIGLGATVFSGLLPALVGNVIGGTGIFAALTYAQVHEEI